MLKKIGELAGAVDIYFLTSQKIFSATKISSSLANFLKRSIDVSKLNKNQYIHVLAILKLKENADIQVRLIRIRVIRIFVVQFHVSATPIWQSILFDS